MVFVRNSLFYSPVLPPKNLPLKSLNKYVYNLSDLAEGWENGSIFNVNVSGYKEVNFIFLKHRYKSDTFVPSLSATWKCSLRSMRL